MVVDGVEELRTMIVNALEGHGFETIEADNGSSALTLAKNHQPDLIISDVIIDNGNGFVLKELLRGDPLTTGIPMILMSGQATAAAAWRSDPEVEYLRKPFDILELLSAVARKLIPSLRA